MEHALLLTVEFDGTDFSGWQRQPGRRTVQLVLEDALARLAGSPRTAIAAGRTDAGVHARGMPVSTTMPARWSLTDLLRALNALLPRDVAVRTIQTIAPGTDARHAARARRYQYDLVVGSTARSPFCGRTVWPLGRSLDGDALHRAAAALPGEHSFVAFMVVGEPKPHYRCTVKEAVWSAPTQDHFRFTVAADRFLHHMVRMLVGTMVDIGLGRRPEEDMRRLLTMTHNAETSPPAPAAGLSFLSAEFPSTYFLGEQVSW